jgi:uncharacterized membrane protein YkvA (DUF1232 family)
VTLWFACRDPATPFWAKLISVVVVAYALSPIDLIPDFIPVLGYVDELILLPALIWLAVRLLPDPVLDASRTKADAWVAERGRRPTSYVGAALVIAAWIAFIVAAWFWYRR